VGVERKGSGRKHWVVLCCAAVVLEQKVAAASSGGEVAYGCCTHSRQCLKQHLAAQTGQTGSMSGPQKLINVRAACAGQMRVGNVGAGRGRLAGAETCSHQTYHVERSGA
jgi:hypothetical protein